MTLILLDQWSETASSERALSELTNYYANTHRLLQKITATSEDASSIRICSHHFDMATLIMLPITHNGQLLTVGIGLSPGDTSYPEPSSLPWCLAPIPYCELLNDRGGIICRICCSWWD